MVNVPTTLTSAPKKTSAVAVPLLLGVTGPRQIDPALVEGLKQEIRGLLLALREKFPHTPLVLLSPLVAGADQLAAEAVLSAGVEAQLAVVLPWPGDRFSDDAERRGDLQHYEHLLAQATHRIEMPLADGVTTDRLQSEAQAREIQYAEVGRYIARHSQILMALWDQVDRPESQTALMVNWHRHGTRAPFTAQVGAIDTAKGAAIRHLAITPPNAPAPAATPLPSLPGSSELDRLEFPAAAVHENAVAASVPFSLKWPAFKKWCRTTVQNVLVVIHEWQETWWGRARHERQQGKQLLLRRWQAIDDFNRDAQRVSSRITELTRSRGYLLRDEEAQPLGKSVDALLELYARSDEAALDYQRVTERTVLTLFAVAAAAIAALETYAHLWHEWPVLLAYLALLGGGYVWYRLTLRREFQGRWLDLRALAETLRVQIFWHVAGRADCTADHYLRHFRGELDWIRHAARAAFLCAGGHSHAPSTGDLVALTARLRLARTRWVVDQLKYFRKKGVEHTRSEIALETAARLAMAAALLTAVIEVILHLSTHHMSHGLVLATFGWLVLAAFCEEYADIQTFSLTARKYQWMAELYHDADQKLRGLLGITDSGNSVQEPTWAELHMAQQVYFELGCEALAENADWVVQHRQRPPVLPSA